METIKKDWLHPNAKVLPNYIFGNGISTPLVEINSIHALNQLVGYVKYLNKDHGEVYFRGQSDLYDNLLPSIYRSGESSSSVCSRNDKIANYVRECTSIMTLFQTMDENVQEPLLQHYGIRTRWIDLVDNLWIALWFCLHKYESRISDRTYEFVYPRDDKNEYAYLLLVYTDADSKRDGIPGFYRGKETDLVDLRMAVPSIFLRPHAQHALLMKPRKMDKKEEVDLSKNVCVIVKLKVDKIMGWLGCGRLLTAENIYPPPVYDHGYSILLEQAPHRKEDVYNIGSITSISFAATNC